MFPRRYAPSVTIAHRGSCVARWLVRKIGDVQGVEMLWIIEELEEHKPVEGRLDMTYYG